MMFAERAMMFMRVGYAQKRGDERAVGMLMPCRAPARAH